jgi:glycosyltransferase involved in cell wall biosynthesis
MPGESNRSFCVPYQPGLLRTIAGTKPDVVVGDGFFQWTFAALLYCLRHGTPLVVCYERWAYTERRAQWYRNLYRKIALRFTAAVCCNGSLCSDYTRSLGFPPARITMGHMAADTEKLAEQVQLVSEQTTTRPSWSARELQFLYVGRLVRMKGLDYLLDAWALFEKQHPPGGTLVIVGSGPEEGNLKKQANRLGLRRVRFVGLVDYDRIVPYYAAADIFVIPTLEDNWSLVVPEAMSCGLPVLCSKYNGCWPELVQEGRNGWVFDPLDPNSCLGVLNLALQNHSKLREMGRESRMIIEKHSPAHAASAIYSTCLLAGKNRISSGPALKEESENTPA